MISTQDNFLCPKVRLRESATYIRNYILKKKILFQAIPKSNVAVAEVHIGDVVFCAGTPSNKKTLIPIPKPKSEGGQFEPQPDPRTKRPTHMDSEYKVLTAIAETLETKHNLEVEGYLYLFTELHPCPGCEDVIRQFQSKFPNMKVEVFWDFPYHPKGKQF